IVEARGEGEVPQAHGVQVEALAEQEGEPADPVAMAFGVGVPLFEGQGKDAERSAGTAGQRRCKGRIEHGVRRGGAWSGERLGDQSGNQLGERAVSRPRAALKRSPASGSGTRTLSLSGPSIA